MATPAGREPSPQQVISRALYTIFIQTAIYFHSFCKVFIPTNHAIIPTSKFSPPAPLRAHPTPTTFQPITSPNAPT